MTVTLMLSAAMLLQEWNFELILHMLKKNHRVGL